MAAQLTTHAGVLGFLPVILPWADRLGGCMAHGPATAGTVRLIAAANVVVAVSLGIGLFTDWSWSSHIANVVHAGFTLVCGVATLMWWRKRKQAIQFPLRLCFWPAILTGVLAVLGPVLMLIPPLTLAALFGLDEIANEQVVQEEPSPSGGRVAIVRYRGVGAYAPGAGRIVIGLRPRLFPLLERRLAGPLQTNLGMDDKFVRWVDSATLLLEEQDVELPVDGTKARWPLAVNVIGGLVGFAAPRVASQISLEPVVEDEQPVPKECERWHVWGLRPGMTIEEVRRFDPDLEYAQHRTGYNVHVWQVVIWERRLEDQREAPELMQWRFGYKGTLFTDSSWGSARLSGFRISAGAIPLGDDGEPVQPVPVIRRLHERWGTPDYAFDHPVPAPVAESWSPHVQKAEVWVDEACGRVARVTFGDGPVGAGENQGSLDPYRYHSIELYNLAAQGIEIEMFVPQTDGTDRPHLRQSDVETGR